MPPRSHSTRLAEIALPATGVVIGILLILGPFLATVIRSMLYWEADGVSLSLKNFAGLFWDPRFYQAALNTVMCGAGATLLSCLLGFSLAWIVSRTDLPGRRWFEILNLVPFFLSPYVGAISWIYLAAPHSGILSQFLSNTFGLPPDLIPIYGIGGAIWVLSLFYTPYVYLFIIAPMRQMDPALEDAARVHGAGFWTTLRHITLPLLHPALISGALVVFVTSAGLFDVPLALAAPKGIRTMPTEIFQLVQYPSDFGRAASFGVVVMAVTVLLTVLQRRYLGQRRFETVTGKGYRPRIIALRTSGRIAAFALEAIYIGAGVVLPVIALLMVSFSSIWTGRLDPAHLTLRQFRLRAVQLFAHPAGHPQQPVSRPGRRHARHRHQRAAGLLRQSRQPQTPGARRRGAVAAARHSGHHPGARLPDPGDPHAALFHARHHPDRLRRALLPVRDPHGLRHAARHQSGARAERARERRDLAADHALRAAAAAAAGDHRGAG